MPIIQKVFLRYIFPSVQQLYLHAKKCSSESCFRGESSALISEKWATWRPFHYLGENFHS